MYLFLSATILLIICGQVINYSTIIAPPSINPAADAQAIVQANDKNAELISEFPHRTLVQRIQISDAYKQANNGKPLVDTPYLPLRGDPFKDLLFAMTTKPMDTYTAYLHAALWSMMPEALGPIIIEILIIVDSIKASFIQTYDNNPAFKIPLLETVSSFLVHDYKHFLQELVRRQREPEPLPYTLNINDINNTVQQLAQECQGWENNRQTLDHLLMEKSLAFGQQVIRQFTQANGGQDIFAAINQNISDQNLKFGYTSLVKYIMNGFLFLAERIHDSENEQFDQHATSILIITAFSEYSTYEIDMAFSQKYNQCVSQYLLSKNGQDQVDQMLAGMVGDYGCQNANNGGFGGGTGSVGYL